MSCGCVWSAHLRCATRLLVMRSYLGIWPTGKSRIAEHQCPLAISLDASFLCVCKLYFRHWFTANSVVTLKGSFFTTVRHFKIVHSAATKQVLVLLTWRTNPQTRLLGDQAKLLRISQFRTQFISWLVKPRMWLLIFLYCMIYSVL